MPISYACIILKKAIRIVVITADDYIEPCRAKPGSTVSLRNSTSMFDCPSPMSIFCEFYTVGAVLVQCTLYNSIFHILYIILTCRNSIATLTHLTLIYDSRKLSFFELFRTSYCTVFILSPS
jgi:hypothetical protein